MQGIERTEIYDARLVGDRELRTESLDFGFGEADPSTPPMMDAL